MPDGGSSRLRGQVDRRWQGPVAPWTSLSASVAALALVPEDRQREGLVQSLSVGMNLSLAALWRFKRFFWLSRSAQTAGVQAMIRSLSIKVSTPEVEVTALSGGNQQKVVIGKALLTQPKLLLLDEPSRGIDVGAKAEVFRSIRRLADEG